MKEDPKRICFKCGNTYGKDTGVIGQAAFNNKCDVCGEKTITVQGAKFAPYNFNKKEEEK